VTKALPGAHAAQSVATGAPERARSAGHEAAERMTGLGGSVLVAAPVHRGARRLEDRDLFRAPGRDRDRDGALLVTRSGAGGLGHRRDVAGLQCVAVGRIVSVLQQPPLKRTRVVAGDLDAVVLQARAQLLLERAGLRFGGLRRALLERPERGCVPALQSPAEPGLQRRAVGRAVDALVAQAGRKPVLLSSRRFPGCPLGGERPRACPEDWRRPTSARRLGRTRR
jgi:hypothetical protein